MTSCYDRRANLTICVPLGGESDPYTAGRLAPCSLHQGAFSFESATTMKAIETRYAGCRFRSRLEARWAVFFDRLGIKWEYEPEGFDMGGGMRYLPDFRTVSPQGLVVWYEVKPFGTALNDKFALFKRHLSVNGGWVKNRAIQLSGEPLDVIRAGHLVCPRCGLIDKVMTAPVMGPGRSVYFYCEACDFNTPSGSGHERETGVIGESEMVNGRLFIDDECVEIWKNEVRSAIVASRSARFE